MTPERRALAQLAALRTERGPHPSLIDAALAIICETLNTPLAKVLELGDSGDQLVVRSGIGWRDGIAGGATVPATNASVAGYSLRHQRAVIFDDVQRTGRFTDSTLLRAHEVVSSMAVRIVAGGKPIGVLSVHELRLRRFTDREAAFIEQAAPIVAGLMR